MPVSTQVGLARCPRIIEKKAVTISFASSLRTTGFMVSGPAALEGFKSCESLRTPLTEM